MTDTFAEYLQNPDRRRLSRFIVAYTEPVTRLVRRIVRCPEASRDVVQDVFLRLAESEVTPDGIGYPRAYVLRAALNIAREYLRDEKTRRRHEREAAKRKATVIHPVEEDVIAREAVERLYRNIDSLPEPLRVAIHLRAVDGLSYKEIGLVTGLPIGTVGSRIREAREALRRRLGDRHLAVAWANLELAREQGWFPAATDGLSRTALSRFKSAVKPARTRTPIVPAAIAGFVALVAIGVSTPWVFHEPEEDTNRIEVATAFPGRRNVQRGSVAPSIMAAGRNQIPMAPVVPGAETEITEAAGDAPDAASPDTSPVRETERGETMTGKKTLLASAVVAVGMAGAAEGSETGDFDGDGKLTLGDVVLSIGNARQPDFPFAPGSFDAFAEYPGYRSGLESTRRQYRGTYIPASVYLESLRRTLSGPFPTFQIVHEPHSWFEEVEQEPLPSDGRVAVRLLPIETAGQPRVAVPLELTTTVPVRAFSLALESDGGMLRVPWVWLEQPLFNRSVWGAERWGWLQEGELRGDHDQGSFIVYVPPTGYLMTGGRYVIVYGTRLYAGSTNPRDAVIPPGTHSIIAHGRLPKGTLPGTYPLRVLEGSQVLLEDGRLVAPVIEGEGEIAVTDEIVTGWDEGLPPLRFDAVEPSVLGKVQFRLADSTGQAVLPDEPVASAMPGETMTFQVQVRTETPLNYLGFTLRWAGNLHCTFGESRFLHELDGEPVFGVDLDIDVCNARHGYLQKRFYLGSNWSPYGPGATAWPDRPLEYFKPLGEWVGLYEVVLDVPEDVPPQVIPLEFMEEPGPFFGVKAAAEFAPYWARDPRTEEPLWHYDVSSRNGFLRIGSEGEPPGVPDPPEHGIRLELKDVAVPAGELVEVPVLASSEESLSRLLLVVEFDPELIKIEALETWGWDPETGLVTPFVVPRGEQVIFRSPECPPLPDHCTGVPCEGAEPCWRGVPFWVYFQDTEERFAQILWLDGGVGGHYPSREPIEIGRLLVRAAPGAPQAQASIRPAVRVVGEDPFAETYESGGEAEIVADLTNPFSPAREFIGATVHIGDNRAFVRGDVNADGTINLSDPILMLTSLFTGSGDLVCQDAADADDNGALNISDPIGILAVLFGGAGALPPPSTCAPDPTDDSLRCDEPCAV